MTNERITEIATAALVWAQGSWGQSKYDYHTRFDAPDMQKIYEKISELAAAKAKEFSNGSTRLYIPESE